MRIGFVSGDEGGCRHYRCYLPARALADLGHTVVLEDAVAQHKSGMLLPSDGERVMQGCDVLVFQRWMHHDAIAAIRKARAAGQFIVNDVDDWFFGIPPSNAAFERTHPDARRRARALGLKVGDEVPDSHREHYRAILAASDLLICSTPFLAEKLSGLAPTVVLRNYIDLDRYPAPASVSRSTTPTLGWVAALPFRAAGDAHVLRGVVGPWMDANPGTHFVHAGSGGTDRELLLRACGLPDDGRVVQRMARHIEHLPQLMTGYDVGLAPLEDCPFNEAKTALKGLEHCAAGIPFIASDLPEYRELGAGILASRPKDWRRALDEMRDPDRRLELAIAGRRRARELDAAEGCKAWDTVLRDLVGDTVATADHGATGG